MLFLVVCSVFSSSVENSWIFFSAIVLLKIYSICSLEYTFFSTSFHACLHFHLSFSRTRQQSCVWRKNVQCRNTKGNTLVSLRSSQSTHHKTLNIEFLFHSFIQSTLSLILFSITQVNANEFGSHNLLSLFLVLFCFNSTFELIKRTHLHAFQFLDSFKFLFVLAQIRKYFQE